MIVCPVCKNSNDDFAVKCTTCSSYIQDRVPNLDFFAIVWLMIESPAEAFKKIIIAEHKNFVLFLGMFLGIAAIFALMWVNQSGRLFDNLFPLLLYGTTVGLIIALPLFYVLTLGMFAASKLLKGKATFNETYGIVGWSLVPIMLSVVFVLPLELAVLGLLLFSSNPSAYEVKPVVTSVLLLLDGSLVLWSMLLAAKGMAIASRFRFTVSVVMTLLVFAGVAYGSFIVYSSFTT